MDHPFKYRNFSCLLVFLLLSIFHSVQAQTPVASFTADKTIGCAPLMVNFNSTSSGAVSYQWTFGNSNSSTIPNPSTVFLSSGTYTVSLTVTSASGVQNTASITVTVVNDPVADFTVSPNSACEDVNIISFTNTSSFSNTYTWDFGDGGTSTLNNPTHTYLNPGNYNVKLIASNLYGCEDIIIKNAILTILAKPKASFNVSQTSSCDITTIFSFSATGAGTTSWNWNFGDGTFSTQQNPAHQFTNPGTYSITLVVTNANGCSDTLVKPNYISIGNSLVPSFTMTDTAGCGPMPVTFNCTVPNATSWNWNLGNGNTSTIQNPSTTYTTPGTYTITLSVTTLSGCNGTLTLPGLIIVDPLPVAAFSVVQDTGCAPYAAQFTNSSSGGASYLWEFGDGGTSTLANPSHTYVLGGVFNVKLHVYSANGCETILNKPNFIRVYLPNANFSGTPLTGCPGMSVQFTALGSPTNIASWFWNFGDGTTSTLQSPSHTYNALGNYNVYLIITNTFGCIDTFYRGNYVHVVPGTIPYTVPDTIPVCQGEPYGFVDPTIGSTTWNWNFGNGSSSIVQNPSVIYPNTGLYTVTLNTSMPGGCSQAFNPFAIVNVIAYNPQPLLVNYISRCKPYTVGFSTNTPNIVAYSWDFGDGTTSTLPAPVHIFQTAGTYIVTLTMTIGAGCVTSKSVTVTVGNVNPMVVDTNQVCKGSINQFTLLNSSAFTLVRWYFGDGTNSIIRNPTHVYASAGIYTPTLITTDTSGCKDTFNLATPISVYDPIASFSSTGNTTACLNTSVQFTNNSQNATSYLWDFGDGTTSTDSIPLHTYTTAGTFTVTLTAFAGPCSKQQVKNNYITVVAPVCNFSFVSNGQCLPVTTTFTDLSPTAISWFWDFGDGTTSNFKNPVHTYTTAPTGSVTLTITDANGCTGTYSANNINYYAASASVDAPTGCIPHTANFNSLSTQAVTWIWDFGDGTTSTLQNPTHTYTTDGAFTVTLIATFPGSCIDTISYPAMVTIDTPNADFYSPTIAGCSPTAINFINTSADAASYLWSFGDGGTSANTTPSHIYYIPGYYTIQLIATNSFGCSDTLTKIDYINIPGTYANFSISSTLGCENLTAVFVDSSINANTWSWNFGDGFISNQQNPNHTYQDTGTYVVTLITLDSLGCTSSFTYPVPVEIHSNPVASASVTDSTGCSFYTTSFTNLSQNASIYLWNFGDGDTSNIDNPTHTYISGGLYQPYVVAITQFGCRDTFDLPTTINVLQTPTAAITASDTVICEPATLTLSSSSSLTQNPSYNWTLGNGNTSNANTFQTTYPSSGMYSVQLVITNSNGCSDSIQTSINILPSPTASGTFSDSTGCSPLAVNFTNSSSGGINYQWNFGNGDSSLIANSNYTFTSGGVFNPQLIAYAANGCTDTLSMPPIDVLQTPQALFSASTQQACAGTTILFINQSGFTQNATYNWTFGSDSSKVADPAIVFLNPGIYDVSLTVTNANGCSDFINSLAYIEIFDTLPPPADQVFTATVLDDSRVEITWANSAVPDLKSYTLYRYNTLTGVYQQIFLDSNPINASTAPTSTYIDTSLDTRNNFYTYKLQTTDLCDYALPLDSLTAFRTVNITATKAGLNIAVSWTPYLGCSVGTYELSRTEISTGISQQIGIFPSTTLNYLDTTLMCPFDYAYRVVATDLCGNTWTSQSDTSVSRPENPMLGQIVKVVRSTVVNNEYVLTEWLEPVIHPERVASYLILRSEDQITYNLIASVAAPATSFSDMQVDVNEKEYYYKVIPLNDCNLNGLDSKLGSSIFLQGQAIDNHVLLRWTKYTEWNSGVDYYLIEHQKIDGSWEIIQSVDGNTTNVDVE